MPTEPIGTHPIRRARFARRPACPRTRKTPRVGGSDLTVAGPRGYTFAITIRCASYPEWLRDGPCDATATGSPTRRMLVLTPAQRLRVEMTPRTPMGQIRWSGGDGSFSVGLSACLIH